MGTIPMQGGSAKVRRTQSRLVHGSHRGNDPAGENPHNLPSGYD